MADTRRRRRGAKVVEKNKGAYPQLRHYSTDIRVCVWWVWMCVNVFGCVSCKWPVYNIVYTNTMSMLEWITTAGTFPPFGWHYLGMNKINHWIKVQRHSLIENIFFSVNVWKVENSPAPKWFSWYRGFNDILLGSRAVWRLEEGCIQSVQSNTLVGQMDVLESRNAAGGCWNMQLRRALRFQCHLKGIYEDGAFSATPIVLNLIDMEEDHHFVSNSAWIKVLTSSSGQI